MALTRAGGSPGSVEESTDDEIGRIRERAVRSLWTDFTFPGILFGLALNPVQAWVAARVRKPEWPSPSSHLGCTNCRPDELSGATLSWFVRAGHCRRCGRPLSMLTPMVAIATAALCAASGAVSASPVQWLVWAVFWSWLLTIAQTDWLYMRVPNVLSLPGAVVFALVSIASGLQPWTMVLVGALSGFGLLFLLHLVSGGRMGLGDAKLYLGLGAMLGAAGSVESLMFAACSGTLLGLGLRACGLLNRRQYMPFVPHIVIGAVMTVFYGHAMTAWYVHHLLGWQG
ncbi:MAG: A24 family peptidase [Alicyclobacillus sp.]|nr:A24 family peptidase [Alicyclobacillus sp.]